MFRKKISLLVLPLMAMVSLQANDSFFNDPFGDDIFKEMYEMQKEMDKIFERMQERMDQRTKLWNYPTRQTFIPGNRTRTESLFEDKGSHYEYNTQIPESPDNQIDISIKIVLGGTRQIGFHAGNTHLFHQQIQRRQSRDGLTAAQTDFRSQLLRLQTDQKPVCIALRCVR